MRLDTLKQYAKLRQQLLEEKSQLESRLNEINQVLGTETAQTQTASWTAAAPAATTPGRRGRRPRGQNTMSLREAVLQALSKGPIARKDLVKAVEEVGYKFTTKNPLNSIGAVLYGKNSPVKSKDGKFYVQGGSKVTQSSSSNGSGAATEAPTRRKRRKMSPEGRARIAAAARARWAKLRQSS